MNPISGSSAQMFAGPANSAASSHQMITMASQMTSLQGKVDRQAEAIAGLVEHVAQLTQLLQTLHPQLNKVEAPKVPARSQINLSHIVTSAPVATSVSSGQQTPDFSPATSFSVSSFSSPDKKTNKFKSLYVGSSENIHGNSVENVKDLISGLPSMAENIGGEDDTPTSLSTVRKFTARDAQGSLYNVKD
jgi:hypothetical protein